MTYEILNSLCGSDAHWSVNKKLAKIIGIESAILLADLLSKGAYFQNKNELDEDGYFFNTRENIENDTTLTPHKQRSCIKILVDLGLLETKEKGIPKKTYYRIVNDKLLKILTTGSEKIKQLDVKKFNINKNKDNKNKIIRINNNMATAKNNVQDDIDKLFYETIKDLKLPVKNHTNLKTKIKELKTTLGDESATMYLMWLKNNWLLVDGEFKPSLNDGIDIWTKHAQIRNWLRSLQKSQITKKGVTL